MLFIVDHAHSAESCPAGKVRPYKEFTNDLNKAAIDNGVKMIEGYTDGPGHHLYFVVEANDPAQIFTFATPLMSVGHTHVVPVMKWNKSAEVSRKLGRQK